MSLNIDLKMRISEIILADDIEIVSFPVKGDSKNFLVPIRSHAENKLI